MNKNVNIEWKICVLRFGCYWPSKWRECEREQPTARVSWLEAIKNIEERSVKKRVWLWNLRTQGCNLWWIHLSTHYNSPLTGLGPNGEASIQISLIQSPTFCHDPFLYLLYRCIDLLLSFFFYMKMRENLNQL